VTLRFLAQELYRLSQKVEELEAALKALEDEAPLSERTRLDTELRKTRKEMEQARAVLEAKKEKPLV
jgi:hypothetical protein